MQPGRSNDMEGNDRQAEQRLNRGSHRCHALAGWCPGEDCERQPTRD
jgi:hypothetical protein